ncbi:unnamed protein product [Heligmosomoides polygyrus]|uniref:dolichyl-P-Man:Man5GlcNAc2-PP-dolichol alpha-1,3-mannosyltransferase n=1 Tax=Heligmosomoides polygyrus TaxID=6339 RepID=A0A183FBY2_HELPZ|nr:unnamed protein product [Heligmosomoides polygyrus]
MEGFGTLFDCCRISFEVYVKFYFSFAVAIKMNVLLFAPALLFVFLLNLGFWQTVLNLAVCAAVQVYVGLPFLMYDPTAYIRRSFDLGRVFLFKWTVNWRFLPEEVFLSHRLHLALLICHLVALLAFGYYMWFRSHGGLRTSVAAALSGVRTKTDVGGTALLLVLLRIPIPADHFVLETLFALFSANLIGITFARSLHYQFYSWYYHQLPFLLFWYTKETGLKQPVVVPWVSTVIK